jgi:hypothetical protein
MELRITFKPRINVTLHPSGESKDQHVLFKYSFSFNNKHPSDVSAVSQPSEGEKCTFKQNNGRSIQSYEFSVISFSHHLTEDTGTDFNKQSHNTPANLLLHHIPNHV